MDEVAEGSLLIQPMITFELVEGRYLFVICNRPILFPEIDAARKDNIYGPILALIALPHQQSIWLDSLHLHNFAQ